MKRLPWFTFLIAATFTLSTVATINAWTALDRTTFFSGQIWRLWTGHLTHFGSDHLTSDLVVWLALGT